MRRTDVCSVGQLPVIVNKLEWIGRYPKYVACGIKEKTCNTSPAFS